MKKLAEFWRWAPGALRPSALALVLAGSALPTWAFDLSELMAVLAGQRSGEATFTEQRHVQGFSEPLAASGTLSFVAPDRFVRRTLAPRAETMAVEGNELTLTRSGRSRKFTLDAAPEMVAVVEALRGTLTGNSKTLQRYFKTRTAGTLDAWTLELTPLQIGIGAQVRSVLIGGRRGEVLSIEMQFAGGDYSVMNIEPLRLNTAPSTASAPAPASALVPSR